MKKCIYSIIVLSILLSATNCSKDFKLFEDYKDITIVYGLVNMEDSITYLRIEKGFLTQGDMYESAQIADSNLFPYKLDVRLETENSEIIFDTITVFNKKGGIFYAPKMQVYYALTKGKFNDKDDINLTIENPKTKEIVSTTTKAYSAKRIKIISPTSSITFDDNQYIDFETIKITRLYQLAMRLHYMEVNPNEPENKIYKYVDYTLPAEISKTTYGNERMSIEYYLNSFLFSISEGIPKTYELERYWGEIELMINTADEDFLAYQQSTSSDYSIIMYRKAYNNIENGYGLFASRASKSKFMDFDPNAKSEIRKLEGLQFKGSIEDYEDNQ